MNIQLSRLEGFFYVARERGYARAARAFPHPITQPGVYQQVRRLERELGNKLFVRAAKDRVDLTAVGQELYRFCAPFFDGLPGVLKSIEAGSVAGALRIDASSLSIRHVLPRWIRQLRKRRPEVQVEVTEVIVPDVERLQEGAADMIIDWFPDKAAPVQTQVVAWLHMFAVVPRDHALALSARRRKLRARELSRETFISYLPGRPHHDVQVSALRARGITAENTVAASSTDNILSFVAAGLGYSIVPWPGEVGPRVPGVLNQRITTVGKRLPVLAAWRKRDPTHPLVAAMLAECVTARR